MFKGNINNVSVSANTNIPITQVFNTNSKVSLNNNTIEVRSSGLWGVDSIVNFTASGTTTTVSLLVNGSPVNQVVLTTVAGDSYQVTLQDVEIIKFTNANEFVDFAIQFSTSVSNLTGIITAEYIS